MDTSQVPPQQSTDPLPDQPPSQPPASSTVPPPAASSTPTIPGSPNPNPKPPTSIAQQNQPQPQPQPLPSFQTSHIRPPLNRPWQATSHFSHYQPHHLPPVSNQTTSSVSAAAPVPAPLPSPVPSTAANPSASTLARGGTAIGVPALHPGQTPPPTSFASSFATSYSGVARNPINVAEPVANSSSSSGRPAMHGAQNVGTVNSQMQPGVLPVKHQQRPLQSPYRPQNTSAVNQSSPGQTFQAPGLLRSSSMGSSNASVLSASHVPLPQNQLQLASGSHGRPPIPTPSRAQTNQQSAQQRSPGTLQSHHSLPTPSQQQFPTPQQQAPGKLSNQQQEAHGQQLSSPKVPPSLPNQQTVKVQGSTAQKPPPAATSQPSPPQMVPSDSTPVSEIEDASGRIISKRSIQELVTQIDPSEKLDAEVEDVLVDIAEEFIESITTCGCLLAKHRRSNTLEAKDILLHLERNWNMTLPGFGGDEIRTYKRPFTSDVHKERLTAVRKSMAGPETASSKNTTAQASSGNMKGGHLAKPAS